MLEEKHNFKTDQKKFKFFFISKVFQPGERDEATLHVLLHRALCRNFRKVARSIEALTDLLVEAFQVETFLFKVRGGFLLEALEVKAVRRGGLVRHRGLRRLERAER